MHWQKAIWDRQKFQKSPLDDVHTRNGLKEKDEGDIAVHYFTSIVKGLDRPQRAVSFYVQV